MPRKTHLLIAALLTIVMLAFTSAVEAHAPTLHGRNDNQPPKGFVDEGFDRGQPDENNPSSEGLRSAVALRKSLTDKQRQVISAIQQRFARELSAAVKQLPALRELPPVSNDEATLKARATEDATTFQAVQRATQQLKAIQDRVDAEISAVLSAEQRTLHRAVVARNRADAGAAEAALAQDSADAAAGGATMAQSFASTHGSASLLYNTDYNETYCFYANTYASYADYYSYVAKYYAYYSYTYYGGTNAYYAYYYLDQADYYATLGQKALAAAYFDEYTLHADPFSRAADGQTNEYYAYNNAYYGYYYAYNSNGSSYASAAYTYGRYINTYAYYAYAYGAYC